MSIPRSSTGLGHLLTLTAVNFELGPVYCEAQLRVAHSARGRALLLRNTGNELPVPPTTRQEWWSKASSSCGLIRQTQQLPRLAPLRAW